MTRSVMWQGCEGSIVHHIQKNDGVRWHVDNLPSGVSGQIDPHQMQDGSMSMDAETPLA